jgi:GRIM-19 protein
MDSTRLACSISTAGRFAWLRRACFALNQVQGSDVRHGTSYLPCLCFIFTLFQKAHLASFYCLLERQWRWCDVICAAGAAALAQRLRFYLAFWSKYVLIRQSPLTVVPPPLCRVSLSRYRMLKQEKKDIRLAIIPLLQAEEDARFVVERSSYMAWEAEVMKEVPGWDSDLNVYKTRSFMQPLQSTAAYSR